MTLQSILPPRFHKGDIVVVDPKNQQNSDMIYVQATDAMIDILDKNKKNPNGIDDELLKSWELPDGLEFMVREVFLNPERVKSGGYAGFDYYIYLLEEINVSTTVSSPRVYVVEEYQLHFSKKHKMEVKKCGHPDLK